ncbi:MAG: ATP-dependent DNA helicase RecG [bacterium]
MDIFSPIQSIPRISPVYQKRLLKLGIKTLRDLFYHFPHRYDDFSNIKPVALVKINETVTIQGKIIEIKNTRTWRKKMFVTEAYIEDKTGAVRAIWFNQPFLADTLKEGQIISLSGKVSFDKTLYLSNPAYEKIASADNKQSIANSELRHTGRLVAVYPETAGISSRWLRYILKTLLPKSLTQFKDQLPLEIKKSQGLLDLDKAIEQIHFPRSKKHAQAARRRLAFDELFLIQLFALQQKAQWQKNISQKIAFDEKLIKNFVSSLPFKLTDAQRKSAWEILQDLDKIKPMNRLLEGDVGSGKTLVAVIAMLQTAQAGLQSTLMAPTEILAQQHFKTITELLKGQNITIGLLTGSEAIAKNNSTPSVIPASEPESRPRSRIKSGMTKQELLKQAASGNIQILIGTHALIEKTVRFKDLALVIVDEQHRFGVSQRAALQKNVGRIKDGQPSSVPHLLSMTATPIPRTLALTVYGDLDISLLDEMPKGRKEIITKIVAPGQRQQAYEFIRQQVNQGRQIFVICPRIEISSESLRATTPEGTEERGNPDQLPPSTGLLRRPQEWPPRNDTKKAWDDVKAVKEEYEKLRKIIFPDLKIAMLHGKLKPKEKEKIMAAFKAGKNDILVSTSVVEVGVDVPNASLMMIEGAERFGLAQLHQFRGRVGRSEHQAYCFLFTTSGSGNARLRALVTSKNGFELAEKDLQIRGPGEFYGTRQWGLPDLSMASLSDVALVKASRNQAQKLIQKDPEFKNYPLLKEKLKEFQTAIHLE